MAMNLRKGFFRIYVAAWALWAGSMGVLGAIGLFSGTGNPMDDPEFWMIVIMFVALCLVGPAILLFVINWIISGFVSRQRHYERGQDQNVS